jgi:hypothetical protein
MTRPTTTEHAPYYAGYVSLVPEANVVAALDAQRADLRRAVGAVAAERERYAYAAGKWTVRDVFGHIGDAERVFGYRAFCIGRGETAPLPQFDENAYVAQAGFASCALETLVGEWTLLRDANLVTFRRLDAAGWDRMGTAAGHPVSVRALAFIMVGHVRHHLRVLAERYGIGA